MGLEHGGPDSGDGRQVEELHRAAERTNVELLVRLPETDPRLVRKALDLGVRSMFVPRVETADDVRAAVRSDRFRHDDEPGHRWLGSPRARRWGLATDYIATEDREPLVGVTIETEAVLGNIEEILAVPELGFVFIGPLDLSVSLGYPGEIEHPEVEAAVETLRSMAVDAGVPIGGLGIDMDDVNEKATTGYQILNLGSTTGAIEQTVIAGSKPTNSRVVDLTRPVLHAVDRSSIPLLYLGLLLGPFTAVPAERTRLVLLR